jgi:hypothetical protein
MPFWPENADVEIVTRWFDYGSTEADMKSNHMLWTSQGLLVALFLLAWASIATGAFAVTTIGDSVIGAIVPLVVRVALMAVACGLGHTVAL